MASLTPAQPGPDPGVALPAEGLLLGDPARWVPRSVVAGLGVLFAAALAGQIAEAGVPWGDFSRVYGSLVGAALAYPALGLLILARRPGNAVGRVFVLIGLTASVAVAAASLGNSIVFAWLSHWAVVPMVSLLPTALLLFPDGRLPSRRWRPIAWIAVAAAVVPTLLMAAAALDRPRAFLLLDEPPQRTAESQLLKRLFLLTLGALLLPLCLSTIAALRTRWLGAEHRVRQQLRVLGLGLGVTALGLAVDALLNVPAILWTALAAPPAAMTVAILKHHLYDIDLFINRTIVYGILSLLVLGVYVTAVMLAGTTIDRGDLSLRLAMATAIVALGLEPVRVRTQRTVNRLLFGDRDDPYKVLSALGQRLEGAVVPEEVLSGITDAVTETLKVPYAAVQLQHADGVSLAAASGRLVTEPMSFPMNYQGERVGTLLVASRAPGVEFTPAELRLLGDLALQTAVAAHVVRLTAALQRSREQLVHAREEERRRLRRELHDGLGSALAGMTIGAGVAGELLAKDPERSAAMLIELQTQLQDCYGDVRRLVHGLRPPVLDERGLIGAVQKQTSALAAELSVSVRGRGSLEDLPAAVEVAAYRIALEAATNSVRHARADGCAITFVRMDDRLTVVVDDDGDGLPEQFDAGVGLTSMRERTGELGGSLRFERSPDGGTRVVAELPLTAP